MPDTIARLRRLLRDVPAWLYAVLAAAVALRIAWIAYVNVHPLDGRVDDTVFYFASARWLADDLAYRDQFGRFTAHWPPGYSLVLAPAFALSGNALAAAKAVNVAFAAAACALTYAVGARAFDRRVGITAAAALAFFPGQIYFSTLLMTEVFFGFLFLAIVALVAVWTLGEEQASPLRLVALGVLAGAAALTRAEAAIFAATLPLLWLVVLPRWRRPLRYAAFFAAGFVLALAPWTVRNAVRFDDFIPLRTGSEGALASALDRNYRDRPGGIRGKAPPLSETAGHMLRHPWEIVPLELEKLGDLYGNDRDGIAWALHERPPIGPEAADRWSALANLYFFAVIACAVAGAPFLLRRRDRWHIALAWGLLGWTGVEIIFWPESRYHFPVVPLLAIFAAAAALRAWERVNAAEAPAAAAPGG